MSELSDTVAIVTGAAQGIGECIARTLLADSATLLLADIQEARVADVAAAFRRDGARVQSAGVDVSDLRQTEQMVTLALQHFGRVDALVNSAGVDAPPGLAWEIDEAHWCQVIDLDLSGTWWCIKSVLPHMMERRKGKIVSISSTSARTGGTRSSPAYSAAKAGLLGLVVALSLQLEQFGILVNAVMPGATGTTGTPMTDEEKTEYLANHPLGFGGPQPVADAVRYLLRPSGDWISGTVLNVSGGRWRGI